MAQAQEKASRTIITCDTAACEIFYWNANGQTYTTDAIETFVSGDTLYVLNLTIDHQVTVSETVAVDRCSYTWRNLTYSQSGTYRDSVPTQSSCDSIFELSLTVTNTDSYVEQPPLQRYRCLCGYHPPFQQHLHPPRCA